MIQFKNGHPFDEKINLSQYAPQFILLIAVIIVILFLISGVDEIRINPPQVKHVNKCVNGRIYTYDKQNNMWVHLSHTPCMTNEEVQLK